LELGTAYVELFHGIVLDLILMRAMIKLGSVEWYYKLRMSLKSVRGSSFNALNAISQGCFVPNLFPFIP